LVEFENYVYYLLQDYKDIKGSSSTSKLVISMNDAGKVKLYGLGAYDFP
jgi:hypothetical protein